MCTKNCCNHTFHAIIFLFILSFLLLPTTPFHKLTYTLRSSQDGDQGVGTNTNSLSPPCTTTITTTNKALTFLYGALFSLIFIIIFNNSSLSSPKIKDSPDHLYHASGVVNPTRTDRLFIGPIEEYSSSGGADHGDQGVGYALLRTFPTFAYSIRRPLKMGKESRVCVICQNKFRDNEMLRWLPECDHVFHVGCIDEWLSSHKTCPCCRADLDFTNSHHMSISKGISTTPHDQLDAYFDYFNEYYNYN